MRARDPGPVGNIERARRFKGRKSCQGEERSPCAVKFERDSKDTHELMGGSGRM